MGKERYWIGKSSKKSVIIEENETKTTPTPPSGCMCAVFQFFDFHPFHFPNSINHQQEITSSCISKDHTTTTVPKGINYNMFYFFLLNVTMFNFYFASKKIIFFWNMFQCLITFFFFLTFFVFFYVVL
jgi:hypothetical protein